MPTSPFLKRRRTIQEGDYVVWYISPKESRVVKVDAGAWIDCGRGRFRHFDWIGRAYGCAVYSHNRQVCARLLHLTPELWTELLPHRTQIVYQTDISVIMAELQLMPGARVVESGTGSASLTHHLARTVGAEGQVYTFEYHELRAQTARQELIDHGLTNVELTHRNVCLDGFDVSPSITGTIDAVFLDLPEPWSALAHTTDLFRSDKEGRICCFSPCIEQVQKTCAKLVECGFTNVSMVECLENLIQSKPITTQDFFAPKDAKENQQQPSAHPLLQTRSVGAMVKSHTAFLTFASWMPFAAVRK